MKTYIYPENLRMQAKKGFWTLRDLVVISALLVVAVFAFLLCGTMIGAVLPAVYAVLTARRDEVTLLEYLSNATAFFWGQQEYFSEEET